MPTALIVGASRGLGRGLVEAHLGRGWDVIATVRKADALSDIRDDRLTVEALDVTDWDGVDRLHERLAGRTLDLLFLNAAIQNEIVPIGEEDPEGFGDMMRTNVLAPLRIADLFADRVTADGTIAAMSSNLGSIGLLMANTGGGLEKGGYDTYRISKVALNMGLASIGRRRADGRTYLLVHPGWVRTAMGGAAASLSVEESARGILDMLAARRGAGGVHYVDFQNDTLPW